MAEFKIDAKCSESSARSGTLLINNQKIKTPVFMPVGTYGAVKTLMPNEISSIGYNLILANTYHMFLRPGIDVLKQSKGLHNFMNWNGLILTDSGGFQIYSLKGLRKIEDNIQKDDDLVNQYITVSKNDLNADLKDDSSNCTIS